jgi:hypothetical protein
MYEIAQVKHLFEYCEVVELLNGVFMDDTFHMCCNSSPGVYFPFLLVLSVTTTLNSPNSVGGNLTRK